MKAYNDHKEEEVVTKIYLDKVIVDFKHYIDLRFEVIEKKVNKIDTIEKKLDSLITSIDWLVGEYKKFDEEHTVLSGRYIDCQQRLDNHDKRITLLEN